MKKQLLSIAVISALTLGVTSVVQAEDEKKGPWTGAAGLGFFSASGNTDSSSLNADVGAAYNNGSRWTHKLHALALKADNNGVDSADRIAGGYQADFAINDRSYFFGKIEADKDDFSAYDLRKTEAVGYGYKIYDTDAHKWNVELGAGATQLDLRNDGGSENSGIGLIGTDYIWNFSETAAFEQNLDYELGSENNYLNSVTSLRAKVWENFGVKLSYNIKNNSDVPMGVEKSDKYTSIGIDYSF